jgi:hypothetical protein
VKQKDVPNTEWTAREGCGWVEVVRVCGWCGGGSGCGNTCNSHQAIVASRAAASGGFGRQFTVAKVESVVKVSRGARVVEW